MFLLTALSMMAGSPSDTSVNLRMASLATAIRYLLSQEYMSDIGPVLSVEAL